MSVPLAMAFSRVLNTVCRSKSTPCDALLPSPKKEEEKALVGFRADRSTVV